jgi:hypothetical protein
MIAQVWVKDNYIWSDYPNTPRAYGLMMLVHKRVTNVKFHREGFPTMMDRDMLVAQAKIEGQNVELFLFSFLPHLCLR